MIFLKKLTKSDLTLISQFDGNGKQKAIILYKDYIKTLSDDFYVMEKGDAKSIDITFYGPDGKSAIHKPSASIAKFKEWRIQECMLDRPADDPDRYSNMKPNDLFLFSLEEGKKRRGRGIFISKASEIDRPLYDAFSQYQNRIFCQTEVLTIYEGVDLKRTYPAFAVVNQSDDEVPDITESELAPESQPELDIDTEPNTDHFESRMVDALQAGVPAASGSVVEISKYELEAGLQEASRIGNEGEALVNKWLETKPLINGKRVTRHSWIADRFATAPNDFEVTFDDGESVLLELKSTNGPFRNKIYLSKSELQQMCDTAVILARIYYLETEPQLRLALEVKERAAVILSSINFPEACGLVSVWAEPEFFDFEDENIEMTG